MKYNIHNMNYIVHIVINALIDLQGYANGVVFGVQSIKQWPWTLGISTTDVTVDFFFCFMLTVSGQVAGFEFISVVVVDFDEPTLSCR